MSVSLVEFRYVFCSVANRRDLSLELTAADMCI
jgi:hypothetical protein